MENLKVLIAEDSYGTQRLLINAIKNIEPTCEVFTAVSESEAWRIAQDNYMHLFIIDNGLQGAATGYDLSLKIRNDQKYVYTPIIYETINPRPMLEYAIKFRYVDYIVKPTPIEEIEKKLSIVFKLIKSAPKSTIEVESKTGVEILDYSDILYITTHRKGIKILGRDKILFSHDVMRVVVEKLDFRFAQCHKSFIVNCFYVNKIDLKSDHIFLKEDKVKIPIGRAFRNDFLLRYSNYY